MWSLYINGVNFVRHTIFVLVYSLVLYKTTQLFSYHNAVCSVFMKISGRASSVVVII